MGMDTEPDWTTVARVKRHLGIDPSNTDYDAKIQDIITAASIMLRGYIGRTLLQADYTEFYDGDATNELVVSKWPINSIASIYNDINRTFTPDTLIDPSQYTFDANDNENVGRIRIFAPGVYFWRGIQNIKVTYNAGFQTFPADAQMACVLLVAYYMNRSGGEGVTAQAMGGKSETYEQDIPMYIRRMIARYRDYVA